MKRRKFITKAGITVAIFPIGRCINSLIKKNRNFKGHKFYNLPYKYDSLEPYIDSATMELHYLKHYKGYYNKFIEEIENTELEYMAMLDIFGEVDKYSDGIRNNGGGFYNHSLFWENITPVKTDMAIILKNAIKKDFGSLLLFKSEFEEVAKKQFGSGWTWLVMNKNGQLFITSTQNQDNPLMNIVGKQGFPLLTIDVWEHAYYLKYKNKRGDYITNFWNVVNWKVVSDRFIMANDFYDKRIM